MDADRWARKRQRWENRMERRARCYTPGRHLFSGMIFVIIGVVFLLGNMGVLEVDRILRFWPVILIALGAFRLIESGDDFGESSGIFWIIIGGFLLLGTMGILRVAFRELWPIVLIGFGALMLWRASLSKRSGESWSFRPTTDDPKPSSSTKAPATDEPADDGNASSSSHFTASAFLGGFERRINSHDFRGGDASVFMGGGKIDLRGASITPPHEAIIKVSAIFGGIEIRIPDDWTVVSEIELTLGHFEDKKAEQPKVETKRLIIRGSVIMGGIEVRN